MKRIIRRLIPLWLSDLYLRKIKRPPCIRCEEIGVLKINDKGYICETCAQIMSELGDM